MVSCNMVFGHSKNCKKQHLALSCLSIHPSAWNNSAPTGWIIMNMDIWVFFEKCRENSSFINIWQQKWVLYVKTYGHLWYLIPFFLELEMFQKRHCQKNQNTLKLPQFTDRLKLHGLWQFWTYDDVYSMK